MPTAVKPTIIYFYDEHKNEELKQYERLKAELDKRASFVKINVIQSPEIASTFKVSLTPMLLAIDNGVEFWRYSGLENEDFLKEQIKKQFAILA